VAEPVAKVRMVRALERKVQLAIRATPDVCGSRGTNVSASPTRMDRRDELLCVVLWTEAASPPRITTTTEMMARDCGQSAPGIPSFVPRSPRSLGPG
jgi:hypothetical protein